jgi:nucleotide-binding universal stress UspA family protein
MKILFAVDGSERALAALDLLIARLGWFKEPPSITLVNVHPPLPYGGATAWVGKENVQKYYEEESQKALKPALQRLATKGLKPEAVTLVGDPAEEIAKYATGHGQDLIAIGTHGRTGLSNLVLGSVATKVLAHTKVPVLLLR